MIVDWHAHIWQPTHLGPQWGPELDANVDWATSEAGAVDELLTRMDAAGVDVAVLLALVACDIELDIPNAFIAEAVRTHPERFVGFGSVDPRHPQAVAQVHEAAALGLRGLKLSPPYQGFHPHSAEAWAVYHAAAEYGMTITFHQGGVFLRSGALEFAQPMLLDKVARSFPEMPIIVAHTGQPWSFETQAVMFKNPNVYTDLSARYGRPAQLAGILRGLIDYGVTDRVLFGSDTPIYPPAECLAQLRALPEHPAGIAAEIDPSLVEDIIANRPLELLGLAPGPSQA